MQMSLSCSKCVLLVGLAVVGLLRAPDAQAQSPDGSSRIVSEYSTGEGVARCLEREGDRGDTYAHVTVRTCHDGSQQRFRLLDNNLADTRIAVDSGYYQRCLGWAPELVFFTVCDAVFNPLSRWKVRDDGKLQILLPPDVYDYDVCLSTKTQGDVPALRACDYNDSEVFGTNWRLPLPAGSPVMLRSVHHVGECLDVLGGQKASNTPLIHRACSSTSANQAAANQVFQVRKSTPGKGAAITVYNGDETLCVASESFGNKIRAVPCNPFAADQQWLATGTPDVGGAGDVFVLTNLLWVNGRRCLDSSTSSQDALAWACHGGSNQKWMFRN